MLKLYCWTDETGQDTKGKFFLVSILLSSKEQIEELRNRISEIEKKTKGQKIFRSFRQFSPKLRVVKI
jgi:hypothetical protein